MQVKHPSKPPIALPIAHSIANNRITAFILPKWHIVRSKKHRLFLQIFLIYTTKISKILFFWGNLLILTVKSNNGFLLWQE